MSNMSRRSYKMRQSENKHSMAKISRYKNAGETERWMGCLSVEDMHKSEDGDEESY